MESTGSASPMPLPQNLREKQIEIIQAFAVDFRVIAKLPTGYGKTKAAAGAFAQLRHRGASNRMLYIVPRRNQAYQAAEELPACLAEFYINTQAVIVGLDGIRAISAHRRDTMCVFIVTVQSLLSRATWETIVELMQTGMWFVAVDEHHHYSCDEDGKWTERLRNLKFTALLAMSATPSRYDHADHFGKPDIEESYAHACELGYVKRLSLHAYQYTIDAVTVDGKVYTFTTGELAKEAGSDLPEKIDAYIASRKLRFSPKYISPLVTFPLDRLIDLRTNGIRAQMLIQAMSCWHAKTVIDQVRMLVPEHISTDWVGTGPAGRSDEENDAVLKRFCPPKDKLTKRRNHTLDILVNVGMAGEGLDTIDVTEVVFLTPANITISTLQTIGRLSRPMLVSEDLPRPIGHVNVDTESPISEYIGAEVMTLFDEVVKPLAKPPDVIIPEDTTHASEYEPLPERLGWQIVDVTLTDIRSEPMFKEVYRELQRYAGSSKTDEECAVFTERAIRDYLNRSNNASAIYAQKRQQIESALSKIAGLVIRRLAETGMRVERTLAGDLRRRINSQKKCALGAIEESADDAALERHWQWLRDLEKGIMLAHGLEGIPRWLR